MSADAEAVGAKQPVDRVRALRREELAPWVRPLIPGGRRDVERTRRDQRQQLVLVEREPLLVPVVLLEAAREPVRKAAA